LIWSGKIQAAIDVRELNARESEEVAGGSAEGRIAAVAGMIAGAAGGYVLRGAIRGALKGSRFAALGPAAGVIGVVGGALIGIGAAILADNAGDALTN
jgi:hypothetical protein